MLIAIVLGLSQAAAAVPAAPPMNSNGQVLMTRAEIKAYNSALARDHPNYVRCQRTLDTGSLVKKTTSCRTNEAWRRAEQIANDDLRYTMDRSMTSQSTAGS